VQHTAHRQTGGGRRGDRTFGGDRIGDVATSTSVPAERMRSITAAASSLGAERPLSTIRPQPAAAIFSARNRPSPPMPPVTR
jgi:hypothetical protein